MLLWNIKAQALRIMFADSGIQFSKAEFEDGILMANGNTREKLIRMDDSIRRGIDRYYDIVGEATLRKDFDLALSDSVYLNEIDISNEETFGFPTRVDIKFYDKDDEDVKTLRITHRQVDFSFDPINRKVYFDNEDYSVEEDKVVFVIWYKMARVNIPLDAVELTYDLDTLHIPEGVQRMLPYFVKGELYEEDEPNMAQTALALYINFLRGIRKPFSKVQTKVKRSRIFTKTN